MKWFETIVIAILSKWIPAFAGMTVDNMGMTAFISKDSMYCKG